MFKLIQKWNVKKECVAYGEDSIMCVEFLLVHSKTNNQTCIVSMYLASGSLKPAENLI